jgi:hypothetical protein
MTSSIQAAQPTEHPGVVRAERAAGSIQRVGSDMLSSRGAATLLLSAIVAALLVVANQVVETWAEGHLLLAWIAMWTVAFAALAWAATPIRNAVHGLRGVGRRWAAARRAAIQDEKLWQVALTDARVMADISRAMSDAASRDVRRYY